MQDSFFTDMAGSQVMFDERGDGMARYTIYNYQPTLDGRYEYKVIELEPKYATFQISLQSHNSLFCFV